jgi:hypothetical protein
MAQFCGFCGQPMEDDARFCVACGQPVAAEQAIPGADGLAGAVGEPTTTMPPASAYAYPAQQPTYVDPYQPVYADPYPPVPLAPAGPAGPAKPLMSKKAVILTVAAIVTVGLGWLGWVVLSPLLTSPASIADQLVTAVNANNDAAVKNLVSPDLGVTGAYQLRSWLGDQSLSTGFQTTSQQGFAATVSMHTPAWDYVLTLTRPWNDNWRVTKIEMTGIETVTGEEIPAPETPEYEEWDLWPSSESEVTLSEAEPGSRSYTLTRSMINGAPGPGDGTETSETITVQPKAAKVFRGMGPAFDPSDWPYSASDPVVSQKKAVVALSATVSSYYSSDTTATMGAKVVCKVRTPTGQVVSTKAKVNDGKPDDTYSSYKTFSWTFTPKIVNALGDTEHPVDRWISGTYYVVFLADDEVVGITSWYQP